MKDIEHHGSGDQKLVDKVAIAHRYSLSTRTIQTLMKKRQIPFFKMDYAVRFDPEECDQVMARYHVKPVSQ